MNKEYSDIKRAVKKNLADFLGTDPEDIENDFSLTEDLHMKASDLTDFIESLSKNGYDTQYVDFSEVHTFSELIDALTQQ